MSLLMYQEAVKGGGQFRVKDGVIQIRGIDDEQLRRQIHIHRDDLRILLWCERHRMERLQVPLNPGIVRCRACQDEWCRVGSVLEDAALPEEGQS
jgi:hypothetical protein